MATQATVFAGVKVRVIGVPVINWGIEAGNDLVALTVRECLEV